MLYTISFTTDLLSDVYYSMDMDESTRLLTQPGPTAPALSSTGGKCLGNVLEEHYEAFNRRDWIRPDPLEAVYGYTSARDREVVGLIAACLAYGRVSQILKSVESVLEVLGPSPYECLAQSDAIWLDERLRGFRHRWTTADELVSFLTGIGAVLDRFGSLERCFLAHHLQSAETTADGLIGFAGELRNWGAPTSLVSAPEKRSACKRLHLYLRWMVRADRVDPGCWRGVSPSQLVVPLDTHMHRIGRALGMTQRKQANFAAALDVTRAFRALSPEDPVRYDFSLTRLGIRQETDLEGFLQTCRGL